LVLPECFDFGLGLNLKAKILVSTFIMWLRLTSHQADVRQKEIAKVNCLSVNFCT